MSEAAGKSSLQNKKSFQMNSNLKLMEFDVSTTFRYVRCRRSLLHAAVKCLRFPVNFFNVEVVVSRNVSFF
jgi:hypothetical protein